MFEDCSQVRIFAVEIDKVRAKMSLLQQIAAAREIVDPWSGLFGPCLVAIEPLAEGSKCQAWRLVDQRLMSRFMNNKAVDAIQELLIGGGFECCRGPGPRRGSRGH